VHFGFQFRNRGLVSGYRAKVSVTGAGLLNVGISRVASNVETDLASFGTGLTANAGSKVKVQAAVVGKTPVRIYVRAWLSGASKPHWQLAFTDYSAARITTSGKTRVWGYVPADAGAGVKVTYSAVKVVAYSVSKAKKIAVDNASTNKAASVPTPSPSPTPTPTPTPTTGTTVSSTGFPDASTTGVPAGTTLTRRDGDITITTDGTILENLDIHGFVTVRAKNVTIRNSIVRGGVQKGYQTGLITNYGYTNLLIENVDVKAEYPSVYFDGIKGSDFTARRVHVTGNVDSVKIHGNNVTITDSLLENTVYYASDPAQNGGPTHNDNIQILKGTNLKITGNTIRGATNFAILGGAEQGAVTLTATSNYLDGGHCTVKLQTKNGWAETSTVSNNTFGPNRAVSSCPFTAYPAVTLTATNNKLWNGNTVTPLILVS
jgi:hypothetical protein